MKLLGRQSQNHNLVLKHNSRDEQWSETIGLFRFNNAVALSLVLKDCLLEKALRNIIRQSQE